MAEYIEREYVLKCMEDSYKNAGISAEAKAKVMRWLKKAPAADVREVKRGKWYWDKDGMDWGIGSWRCSECHARPETWWQGDSTNPRNKSGHYFCPNCGADMRETNDEKT